MSSRDLKPTAAPLLVRLAGLPIRAIEPFGGDLCGTVLKDLARVESSLDETRREMVDRLHAEIGGAPREVRRSLLAVKRDCFNGRSLARRAGTPAWSILSEESRELGGRILDLEERLAAREAAFREAYVEERVQNRRHLVEVLQDRSLERGIALASRVLAANLDRLTREPGAAPGDRDRKVRRLETSLLRYVSRTAVKLSPYSTLTRLGLGAVREEQPEALRLEGGPWRERSLLRLKRYVLDQYWQMLLRHPPLRRTLRIDLNSTVELIAPGRFGFLRPSHWEIDAEAGKLRFVKESLVKVNLEGPLISWVREALAAAPMIFEELVSALDRFLGDRTREKLEMHVEELLEIGFLCLLPPWPSNEGHLERRMVEDLRGGEGLEPFVEILERIVALESGYATAASPVQVVEEIDRLIEGAWKAVAPLGGLDAETRRNQVMRSNFYEDVFLVPADAGRERREVLGLGGAAVDEVLRHVEPLVRLKAMNHHRHDFLHSMAAFMSRRWPERREVGVLELFGAVQPLWTEYLKFDVASRRAKGWTEPFNPLGLPQVAELHRHREVVWAGLRRCTRVRGEESEVVREELEALVDRLPARYLPAVGGCLFLQPADRAGGLWVLNRIYEGVGRFGSRFTPSMEGEMRRRYTDRLTMSSSFEWQGEWVELVDIFCTQGDTLNVHPVQTRRILEIPGEHADLPRARTLTLCDLQVVLDPETGLPRLIDREGGYVLPVHLGGASHIYMPSLVKFLCALGPGEGNLALPAAHTREEGEMKVRSRLSIGNVVLRRKRWVCPPDLLLGRIAGLGEARAFAEINRWRSDLGIPERVFRIERVRHELLESRYKPQYLDFTSPLFVELFRSALTPGNDPLVLEEMLPALGGSPCDEAGESWAVELLLDTIAIRPRAPSPVNGFVEHEPEMAH